MITKTIILIETTDELLRFANPHRAEGNDYPYLDPKYFSIKVGDGRPVIQGINDEGVRFQLAESITYDNIIQAMAKQCNLNLEIG